MSLQEHNPSTVELDALELSPVTEELRSKYSIPTESTGAVIVSGSGAVASPHASLEGCVISRVESDQYEAFVASPDDLTTGVQAMKSLGDKAASIRVLGPDNRYRWVRVLI